MAKDAVDAAVKDAADALEKAMAAVKVAADALEKAVAEKAVADAARKIQARWRGLMGRRNFVNYLHDLKYNVLPWNITHDSSRLVIARWNLTRANIKRMDRMRERIRTEMPGIYNTAVKLEFIRSRVQLNRVIELYPSTSLAAKIARKQYEDLSRDNGNARDSSKLSSGERKLEHAWHP